MTKKLQYHIICCLNTFRTINKTDQTDLSVTYE